jgi:uncharacterized protein (TIGR02217 family)
MFNETQLDPQISYYVIGGRRFMTTTVQTYGGDEFRNAAWAIGLGQWDIASALRSTNPHNTYAYRALRNLFFTSLGQWGGFRMRDWKDYQDEGGGIFVLLTATTFQMYKRVTLNGVNYDQIINKPATPIVVTGGTTPVVDYTTGIVTVASGTPTAWTGNYDIAVRFADDTIAMGPDNTAAYYEWQQVKLVELRNP